MNAIVGYSNMLQEEADNLSQEQRDALERIQSNSANFLGYVESLFYLSELNGGLHPVAPGPVDVAAVLSRVCAELSAPADTARVALRVEVSPGLACSTDEDKLTRLVRALADNGVRFTPPGGKVVLRAVSAPEGVVLEVRDTGPGLPTDLAAEAMHEALSGPSVGRGSTRLGFGLRLAARVARILGASIAFDAGPAGTTCRLLVPNLAPHVLVAVNGERKYAAG
jgi:signal transduction histidine kinase